MKNIFILFILIGFNVSSQNFEGKVLYKKKLRDSEEKHKKEEVSSYLSGKDKHLQTLLLDIDFLLEFNNNESFFYAKTTNFEVEEDRYFRLAKIIGGNSGEWYINLSTKEKLRKVEAFGGLFLVSSKSTNNDWKLINESKQIGNYFCHKATTYYIVKNSKGIFRHPVEVWYTSNIPVSFGPIGYGGLPGLIVELSVRNVTYSIKEVILNPKKKLTIKKPTKGKLVTEKEFDEIGRGAMSNFKSKISN
jgi:GLPGLI family protein